ncbi:MAG: TldD/PmbA family protein [Clostridia bacterium]|nr:TldD/PmbA family protein [Clostridia bacterium]MBR2414662.1 TldD/PmbA family protein [Clostridia bacterium]
MNKLKATAEYVLRALKNAGADHAQCSVSSGKKEEFNIDAGEFSLLRSVFNSGVSMKVLKDGKMGQTFINSLEEQDIDAAALECVQSAEASVPDESYCIASLTENADFEDGTTHPDRDVFFDRVREFLADIGKEFPSIMVEQIIAEYTEGISVLANTNGVLYTQKNANYSVGAMYSAHNGDESTSFNSFGIDYTDPDQRIMDMGDSREMFARCEAELGMRPLEGKFEGVALFAPGCLDSMLSTVLDNFCSDSVIVEGTSPWKNAIGTKVADESFTLRVISHDDRVVCGERVTDDGYISEDFDIIKDGILQDFCLSEYAARKTGLTRAPSTSGCIGVTPGKIMLAELIDSIEKGILVCRFSGGEPATNGDFSGVAKNSFYIENGRIAHPVSETMISGNLAAMLKNVVGISEEVSCDGTCVLPYVAFGGITVSGG